ncbi:hypothetical protein JTB14_014045 [Gonioctena quinquepunctata]|nr:hypothetical protein JTB14_014045 [Gonioctena quinquepunctata]
MGGCETSIARNHQFIGAEGILAVKRAPRDPQTGRTRGCCYAMASEASPISRGLVCNLIVLVVEALQRVVWTV